MRLQNRDYVNRMIFRLNSRPEIGLRPTNSTELSISAGDLRVDGGYKKD